MEERRIIEVNGIKLEVDLSTARVVDNYRIGDQVKVLVKDYLEYKSFAGVIIGFDNFKERPTIIIAYLRLDYSEASIKFIYFNSDTKEAEICPANPRDIPFDKNRVMELLDRKITKTEEELSDLKNKKDYFLTEFGKYFGVN